MKKFYSKLENNFINPASDWHKFKGESLYSQYISGSVILQYFNIHNEQEFIKQHRQKIFSVNPSRVSFAIISGKGMLFPHKDHGCQVSLNYYITANEDITNFYNINNSNASGIKYPGKIESNIFNEKDLKKEDNFIANSNDLFLLNVTEIHSVEKINNSPRMFIAYSWDNITYDELLIDIQNHIDE